MRAFCDGDADADRDERALRVLLRFGIRRALALVDRGGCAVDICCDARDRAACDVLEEQDEFVAAKAPDEVAAADDGAQAFGETDENLVTERMAAEIVRGLEMIEIHHEERMAVTGRRRFEQKVPDHLAHGGLVIKAGQRIDLGLILVVLKRGALGGGKAATLHQGAQEERAKEEEQHAADREAGLQRVKCEEVVQREMRRCADLVLQQDAFFFLRVEAQERFVEHGLQQARLIRGDGDARADEDTVLRWDEHEIRVEDEVARGLHGDDRAQREIRVAIGNSGECMLLVWCRQDGPSGELLPHGLEE